MAFDFTVKEGARLKRVVTFEDVGLVPEVVLDWDVTNVTFSGTATRGKDYTYTSKLLDRGLKIVVKAKADDEFEDTEIATAAFSGWIEWAAPGGSDLFINILGQPVAGSKTRFSIADDINVAIIDNTRCPGPKKIRKLEKAVEDLQDLEARAEALRDEADTINEGRRVAGEARQAINFGIDTYKDAIRALSKSEQKALSAEIWKFRKAGYELNEAIKNLDTYPEIADATDRMRTATERFIEEANSRGLDLPTTPGASTGDTISQIAAEIAKEAAKGAAKLLFHVLENLSDRGDQIADMMEQGRIDSQLEDLKPRAQRLADDVGIDLGDRASIWKHLNKSERKIERELDAAREALDEAQDCAAEHAVSRADSFVFAPVSAGTAALAGWMPPSATARAAPALPVSAEPAAPEVMDQVIDELAFL